MLKTDQQFGRYRIISVLGSGGMGEVYLAEDTQLKRKVALKILNLTKPGNSDDYQRRFIREAQAISALNHPNIVIIYEISELERYSFYRNGICRRQIAFGNLLKTTELSLKTAIDIGIRNRFGSGGGTRGRHYSPRHQTGKHRAPNGRYR